MTAINFATQKGQRTVAPPLAKTVASSSHGEATSTEATMEIQITSFGGPRGQHLLNMVASTVERGNGSRSLSKDTISELRLSVVSPMIVRSGGEKTTITTVTVSKKEPCSYFKQASFLHI